MSYLSGAALCPQPILAHDGNKRFRVALITAGSVMLTLNDVREDLAARGWIEGKNIAFDYGYGNDDAARLDQIVADVVARRVDVIVAWGTLAPLAAKRGTSSIPIVMAGAGDAVGSGLVSNLARPPENVTGYSFVPPEMSEKRLQLIVGSKPGIKRVAIVWNRNNPHSAGVFSEIEKISVRYRVAAVSAPVAGRLDGEAVFENLVTARCDAIMIVEDPLTNSLLAEIAQRAIESKLPSLGERRAYAVAGGLISYGPDLDDSARWVAAYVDRILRGETPADLPVQQPTKFVLVINGRTAKAIDVNLPFDLLARAEEILD
ncbi:ABC transporter substrate-binding protein [Methylobacterium sp. C33D]